MKEGKTRESLPGRNARFLLYDVGFVAAGFSWRAGDRRRLNGNGVCGSGRNRPRNVSPGKCAALSRERTSASTGAATMQPPSTKAPLENKASTSRIATDRIAYAR
jgi:hypothetical protein